MTSTRLVGGACVFLATATSAYVLPTLRPEYSTTRPAILSDWRQPFTPRMMADDDDEKGGELSVPDSDMELLRARIAKIQENGGALATPSQKYFDLAMKKPPQQLMQEFFLNRSPKVVQAMQEATVSLLGYMPPELVTEATVTTTGDKLAALMLQLQMTGYMLRNAEYVMTLRSLLQLKSRSAEEYRAAFDRIDTDGSGYIEMGEVEALLKEVYKDGEVPSFEITAFLKLFDTDGDGKISWEEFSSALGAMDGMDGGGAAAASGLMLGSAGSTSGPSPQITGDVTVELDDGGKVEMDAAAYMDMLKEEAAALREELAKVQGKKAEQESAISSSLSAYVSSLPEDQLKLLTSSISDDVSDAMKQIVTYILRAPSGEGELSADAEVKMEQQKLQQLCIYQLMLGYTLREAEATGEADDMVGK